MTAAPGWPKGSGTVAIVVKGYPRLSETFIAQELLGLQRAGLPFVIISLRHPTDRTTHAVHREITAPVIYLPEYLHQEPARVAKALKAARHLPGFDLARRLWMRDLWRDVSRNRVRRFGQAAVLATELPPGVDRIYAHFLHTPASVARYAARMRGLPWAASAHAKDIWTTPDWDLAEKLADADWTVTCTANGHERLAALTPDPARLRLVHHGLDMGRFPPPPERAPRDGGKADEPLRLLTVCRAVEKKGLDVAIRSLASLPRQLHWHWTHIGGGPLRGQLQADADRLGLTDRVTFMGARPQDEVIAAYCRSDLFVLPSRVASDGDRDGLPNVLMEAMALALPCIATRMPGVLELMSDGVGGLLVPPDDEAALADAILVLGTDAAKRSLLGASGHRRVIEAFLFDKGLRSLCALIGAPDQDGAALSHPMDRVQAKAVGG